jgi:hypothetical protein
MGESGIPRAETLGSATHSLAEQSLEVGAPFEREVTPLAVELQRESVSLAAMWRSSDLSIDAVTVRRFGDGRGNSKGATAAVMQCGCW